MQVLLAMQLKDAPIGEPVVLLDKGAALWPGLIVQRSFGGANPGDVPKDEQRWLDIDVLDDPFAAERPAQAPARIRLPPTTVCATIAACARAILGSGVDV